MDLTWRNSSTQKVTKFKASSGGLLLSIQIMWTTFMSTSIIRERSYFFTSRTWVTLVLWRGACRKSGRTRFTTWARRVIKVSFDPGVYVGHSGAGDDPAAGGHPSHG